MTQVLAVLGLVVAFVAFGMWMRGRQRVCGSGCSCEALRAGGGCEANPDRGRSEHARS